MNNTSSSTCLTSLPPDILLKILTGLPAKSVIQFRCVSKFFYSVIPEPYLAFSILVSLPSRTRPILNLYTVSCNEGSHGKLQANSVQHVNIRGLQGSVTGSSYADGKICLFSDESGDAAICDLRTGQRTSLPRVCLPADRRPTYFSCGIGAFWFDLVFGLRNNYRTVGSCAALGFDHVSRRHKVFKSELYYEGGSGRMMNRQWVLTLGVDRSWRVINSISTGYLDDGVHIDGIVYFIPRMSRKKIVAFDVRTESFIGFIPFPDEYQTPQWRWLPWINLNGRLAFIKTKKDLSGIDIWSLEESMVWEKLMIPLPFEESLVIGQASSMGFSTTSTEEIVFLLQSKTMSPLILLYSFRRRVWRQFEICGVCDYSLIRSHMRGIVHVMGETIASFQS